MSDVCQIGSKLVIIVGHFKSLLCHRPIFHVSKRDIRFGYNTFVLCLFQCIWLI